MIFYTVIFCLCVLALSVLCGLYRIVKGPTPADRFIGMDAVTISLIGGVVIASFMTRSHLFVELILAITLLGFVSTAVLVIYVMRAHRIRQLDVSELVDLANSNVTVADGRKDDDA